MNFVKKIFFKKCMFCEMFFEASLKGYISFVKNYFNKPKNYYYSNKYRTRNDE